MSLTPIITFKAGMCDFDETATPRQVEINQAPGFLYLYTEDDVPHFAWRSRSSPMSEADLDLMMFPGDATFKPYRPKGKSPINGRIYVLKFSSSSARHFFWLQSKSQHPSGDAGWFSPRDLKLGEIVNQILQGNEVDVQEEIANIPQGSGDDDDTAMEDADDNRPSGGDTGAGATGGDFTEDGEESRRGGEDGGRA